MKFYKIIIAIATMLVANSCSQDYLDTKPLTQKTDLSYYTTPTEAQEALVGCYDGLQQNYADVFSMPICAVILSDLTFGGTGATDADDFRMLDEYDINVAPSYMNIYNNTWINCYKTIFRSNMLISRLDQVDWEDNPQQAKDIEAEARFIRAFTYFDMVRMFERIPLLTEPSSENIPQSDPDETYALIAEDLLFAVNNMSATAYNNIASSEYGYITKWAAEALLARVYLFYTGYYGKDDLLGMVTKADALSYVEDIIANSGHGLVDNFYDLWPAAAQYQAVENGNTIDNNTYAGEDNKEVVFSIKYTYTGIYDGNHWVIMNGMRLTTWPERGYDTGWGANTVSSEFYDSFDPNDDRRAASIIAIEEEGIEFSPVQAKEYTGYYNKKYTPLCTAEGNSLAVSLGAGSNQTGQNQDYIVVRYADVLLMAAELGSSNALSYVNQVRERAHVSPVASVNKDLIFNERKLELAFEGLRYWDLLRYDHTLAYAAEKLSYNGILLNGDNEVAKVINGDKLFETKGLFQIPNNQITLSDGVLTQNPGW
ncbi:MAG: RagB/SusD family nutrient uptake outer membrane protein [Prolixibacteraceae bacterium]|jgi:hypothetical protein|nr:RagB/SusD family nutrient uptake outer membrane protein [Prolixibacteraceae bacterium]